MRLFSGMSRARATGKHQTSGQMAFFETLEERTFLSTSLPTPLPVATAGPAHLSRSAAIHVARAASGTKALSLPSLPQRTVDQAIAYPLIRYNRYIAGGAHTNQPGTGGAPEILALAALEGNTSADARLLEQMRYTITGGNDISANGGYSAQHERHVTAMYAIARQIPRIWNQLTAAEKNRIDLLMKAALVSSAFTTSDSNPYIRSHQQQHALDGDPNLGRDWNPNYREGMLGGMLAGLAYFGGPARATGILNTYDHRRFVQQLKGAGLSDIYQTFNWKVANPTSGAPTGTMIRAAVRNWKYYGLGLGDYMQVYAQLTSYTFGRPVSAGLNGGKGIGGVGRIATGAAALPNKGAMGMITEFASSDANGPRSSAIYAYDAFRIHETNHLVLIATGWWKAGAPGASDSLRLMSVGARDLWYKLDHGYLNYAKGRVQATLSSSTTDKGYQFTRPLWSNVIKRYHGL